MKDIIIRAGTEKDLPDVLDMIVELAIFEKEESAVENTIEMLRENGFGEQPVYHLLIAERAGKTLGMAMYYYCHSSWKGKMLYLDDLVVREAYRREGLGTLLIKKLFKVGEQNKVKGIKWEVLDWNTPAVNLYKKIGMRIEDQWWSCKAFGSEYDRVMRFLNEE